MQQATVMSAIHSPATWNTNMRPTEFIPQQVPERRKYLATLRITLEADTEVEARVMANQCAEAVDENFNEDEEHTVDLTQIIPWSTKTLVTPEEVVAQLRSCCNLLIKTKIVQCFELAREMHKVAWILENRRETTFDMSNYDHGEFQELANQLLGRP